MVDHLLSLCDLMRSARPDAEHEARRVRRAFSAKLSAALCREAFKLGCGATDERALRELVRALCSLAPDDCLDAGVAAVLGEVAGVVRRVAAGTLDRASDKMLEEYVQICAAVSDEEATGVAPADR